MRATRWRDKSRSPPSRSATRGVRARRRKRSRAEMNDAEMPGTEYAAHRGRRTAARYLSALAPRSSAATACRRSRHGIRHIGFERRAWHRGGVAAGGERGSDPRLRLLRDAPRDGHDSAAAELEAGAGPYTPP